MIEPRRLGVIVVDDDADDCLFTSRALRRAPGCRWHRMVPNGAALLDDLHREEDRPDVILLDIQMPVMDGWTALKQLDRDDGLREIPVLVLVPSSSAGEIAMARAPTARGYVVKPVTFQAVLDALER